MLRSFIEGLLLISFYPCGSALKVNAVGWRHHFRCWMECQVCTLRFDAIAHRPKILPCGHTLCLKCIQELPTRTCPLDNMVFTPSPESLVDNLIVLDACNTFQRSVVAPLWCRSCNNPATEACVDDGGHAVVTCKKARLDDAGPLLEELDLSETALDRIAELVSIPKIEEAAEDLRHQLQRTKASLHAARERLLAAREADDAAWGQAKQGAAMAGLSRLANDLVAVLSDPSASCTLSLRCGDAAWSGDVRPAEDAAARLVLCRLLCGLQQRVKQEPEELVSPQRQPRGPGVEQQGRHVPRQEPPQQNKPQQGIQEPLEKPRQQEKPHQENQVPLEKPRQQEKPHQENQVPLEKPRQQEKPHQENQVPLEKPRQQEKPHEENQVPLEKPRQQEKPHQENQVPLEKPRQQEKPHQENQVPLEKPRQQEKPHQENQVPLEKPRQQEKPHEENQVSLEKPRQQDRPLDLTGNDDVRNFITKESRGKDGAAPGPTTVAPQQQPSTAPVKRNPNKFKRPALDLDSPRSSARISRRGLSQAPSITPNEISLEEMASRIKVGSRVARGKNWERTREVDGKPPGPGTVLARKYRSSNGPFVEVKWDRDPTKSVRRYAMERSGNSSLRLLSATPLRPHLRARDGDVTLDADIVSSVRRKKVAEDGSLAKVKILRGLPCSHFPTWCEKVLQQVAPHLKGLQMVSPSQRHIDVALAMLNLQALCLTDVTAQQLQQVTEIASLRSLEVHGQADSPLTTERYGTLPRLKFLRCGVYPLAAALGLMRAHAGTLKELQLVAASCEPYGCPDLALELLSCGFKTLKRVMLVRTTGYNVPCRHDRDTCKDQRSQIHDAFAESNPIERLACSVCGAS
ncbi:uncharacterized protein LOC117642400 isoform X3 [Thrips palmi]|uniref:Uncharacterized protein LOC117642400 isoform X3 n=1 Tax=Thrips palmi TaxID=161013 RepID=A0A6P8YIH0_THRPL|nr:uncharacterized protein LOC117642400 isoform X3 [Thrips palmi]